MNKKLVKDMQKKIMIGLVCACFVLPIITQCNHVRATELESSFVEEIDSTISDVSSAVSKLGKKGKISQDIAKKMSNKEIDFSSVEQKKLESLISKLKKLRKDVQKTKKCAEREELKGTLTDIIAKAKIELKDKKKQKSAKKIQDAFQKMKIAFAPISKNIKSKIQDATGVELGQSEDKEDEEELGDTEMNNEEESDASEKELEVVSEEKNFEDPQESENATNEQNIDSESISSSEINEEIEE